MTRTEALQVFLFSVFILLVIVALMYFGYEYVGWFKEEVSQ